MVLLAIVVAALMVADDDTEVVVELPGTFRPVAGISLRYTAEHGEQLVVLADL